MEALGETVEWYARLFFDSLAENHIRRCEAIDALRPRHGVAEYTAEVHPAA